ncbi:MAG: Gfo/Idh/MocA family oxidoreductase [Candidatus Poribacteria bacterium]|nr:Gfo/Idh/MocA family oxidoreductase [Candidatus Poribacteria bacterium]
MDKLKIAVVGTGSRAGAHLRTIPKLDPIYQLVGVCDIDERRAAEVAQRMNVSGYTDVETLIASASPDVLLITIPPDGHHVITEIAASHGVHVITETPIATTLPCADRMIDAADRYGVKLEVAENVWRWPRERLKRKLVDAGLIGEITHAHLWYTSGSYHGMNAIRTLVQSEAVRVIGHAKEIGECTWEVGVVEFENGVSLVYEFPTRRRGNYWEIDGTKGAILGEELQIYAGNEIETYPIQTVTTEVNGVEVVDHARVDTDPPVIWENPLKTYGLRDMDDVARGAELHSIYRAVVEGGDAEYGAINGRKDQEILIALRESARRGGEPIDLPLTEVTAHEERHHQKYREKYGVDPFDTIEAQKTILFPRRGVAWEAR